MGYDSGCDFIDFNEFGVDVGGDFGDFCDLALILVGAFCDFGDWAWIGVEQKKAKIGREGSSWKARGHEQGGCARPDISWIFPRTFPGQFLEISRTCFKCLENMCSTLLGV